MAIQSPGPYAYVITFSGGMQIDFKKIALTTTRPLIHRIVPSNWWKLCFSPPIGGFEFEKQTFGKLSENPFNLM